MEHMNEFYSCLSVDRNISSVEVDTSKGNMIAVYLLDFWHRAQVVSEGLDELKVLAVDFGTHHIIPKRRVRHLYSQFKKESLKARKGKLANFHPSNGDKWTDKELSAFTGKVAGKSLTASIAKVKDSVYELVITKNGLSLADHLVKKGFGAHSK